MTTETKPNLKTLPVLSIDAWGNPEDGYEWNEWFNVGTIDLDLDAENREIIQAMVNAGYLTCLLYTSPSPRDKRQSRMPSSA